MPTVLRLNGWRFAIYTDDHQPAHVHVLGRGWMVKVHIVEPVQIVAVVGDCSERDALKALSLVDAHKVALMVAWERIYG